MTGPPLNSNHSLWSKLPRTDVRCVCQSMQITSLASAPPPAAAAAAAAADDDDDAVDDDEDTGVRVVPTTHNSRPALTVINHCQHFTLTLTAASERHTTQTDQTPTRRLGTVHMADQSPPHTHIHTLYLAAAASIADC